MASAMPVTLPQVNENQKALRLASAMRSLTTECEGMTALVSALKGPLGLAFSEAVGLMFKSRARAIISGVGKSGHVARKIAATLASTGTPALYVHPTEASHGDLGMITREDVVLALSNSGESLELSDIISYTRRFAVPLIAFTASAQSTLGRAADIALVLPKAKEACPNGLAPTTSTILQLAMGDALAVALLEERGFTARHFRDFHPGGKLGAALKLSQELMRKGEALPLAPRDQLMRDALVVMTEKACGCLGIIDADGRLAGIITDGDLRRHMSGDLLLQKAGTVMTVNPKTIDPLTLAAEALEILNDLRITSLFVVDAEHRPLGLLHIHDLLRAGVG